MGATGATGYTGATGASGPRGPAGPTGSLGVVVMYNDTYAHSFISLSTDYKTVANVTLAAPSNGYVVLSVNAMADLSGDSTIAGLGLGMTSDAYPNLSYIFAGPTGAETTTYLPMSVQAVVPVTAGNSYTFFAIGCLVQAWHPADLYYIYMTGVFYPA